MPAWKKKLKKIAVTAISRPGIRMHVFNFLSFNIYSTVGSIQVLASLPEIDDPKLVLPRLGSYTGFPEVTPEENNFMDSLLTGEKNNNMEASESSPEFKGRILAQQRGQTLLQHLNHPGLNYSKLGPTSGWKMPRPMDGAHYDHQFHRQVLELGTTSQRPTTLTLRPASESAMRQVENVLMPLRPSVAGGFDEEVQSTFRTTNNNNNNQGNPSFSASTHNEGLESIFSFNYDQPRSTINALLPASTSAGPNTDLGFSGSPQYSRARTSPNYHGYNA